MIVRFFFDHPVYFFFEFFSSSTDYFPSNSVISRAFTFLQLVYCPFYFFNLHTGCHRPHPPSLVGKSSLVHSASPCSLDLFLSHYINHDNTRPSFLCFFSVHQNLSIFAFYCCLSWLPFPVDAFNEFIHLPCLILSSELLNIATLFFYPILFIFPGQCPYFVTHSFVFFHYLTRFLDPQPRFPLLFLLFPFDLFKTNSSFTYFIISKALIG